MIEYAAFLIAGLVGLWISADKTVENAEKLIKAYGIPGFMFGAVFISISTGLPELATALISTFEGVPELSAGDIIGSSLVNLTFVLGISILAAKGLELHGEDLDLVRDAVIATMFAALVLIVFQSLSLGVVVMLLTVYAAFLYRVEHSAFQIDEEGEASSKEILLTLIGVAALLLSARIMVAGAKGLGEAIGIPIEILGATVVAVGTGLPELAFEVTAIRKGDYSLALGDIFGSTLVNITLSLGLLGLISTPSIISLMPVLLGLVLVGGLTMIFSWKGEFSRIEALILLAVFLAYILFQAF
ncbi:MAG: sodium:calcium antiporter [Candidatus Nanohaloarchaea archaeon]